MPSAVERLAAAFAALGIERPHVAGNSLGGLLALEAAAAGHVARPAAISSAGIRNRRQRAYSLSVPAIIPLTAGFPKPVVPRGAPRIGCSRRLGPGAPGG